MPSSLERSGSGPAPRSGSVLRDGVLRALFGGFALLACWLTVVSDEGLQVIAYWSAQPVLDVLLVLLAYRVARQQDIEPSTRRFWRWLSVAGVSFAAGDAVQTWTALRTSGVGAAVIGGAPGSLIVVGVLLVLGVVLTHPIDVGPGERFRIWLDATTVMAGAGVFVWYLNAHSGQVSVSAAVGSTLVLVTVFGLARLSRAKNPPFTRASGLFGIVGVSAVGLFPALLADPPSGRALGPWLALRLLPSVLVTAMPRVQEVNLRRRRSDLVERRRSSFSLLPYLAVAGALALLLIVTVEFRLPLEATGVVVGIVATTALVVVRQLTVLRDNAALLEQLDASMRDLRGQERRFRALAHHSADVTVVLDPSGVMTYVSPAVERTLGAPPARTMGRPALELIDPEERPAASSFWADVLRRPGETLRCTLRVPASDGTVRWLGVIATNLIDEPAVGGVVCNARDVTEAHLLSLRLQRQALRDPLTQLLNRTAFEEQLDTARRDGVAEVALLLIDLDDFKPVNDRHGHHVGDALLIEAAARMNGCLRGSQDALARLGGDEFAVLLPGVDRQGAERIARRILGELQRPFVVEGREVTIGASVGAAVGPAENEHALLRAADSAMYVAKRAGKGGLQVADDADQPSSVAAAPSGEPGSQASATAAPSAATAQTVQTVR